MLHALAKNWWLILLRGIAAILFGVLTFAWPGITLLTLILVYGIYALADGVLAVWAAFSGGTMAPRWWLLVVGLIGILAGLVAIVIPGITALVLLLCIAGWAIATGIIQIVAQPRAGALGLILVSGVSSRPCMRSSTAIFLVALSPLSVLFGLILVAVQR